MNKSSRTTIPSSKQERNRLILAPVIGLVIFAGIGIYFYFFSGYSQDDPVIQYMSLSMVTLGVLFALIMGFFGLKRFRKIDHLVNHGIVTKGIIDKISSIPRTGLKYAHYHFFVDGQKIKHKDTLPSSQNFKNGDPISVLYNPEKPKESFLGWRVGVNTYP